MRCIGFRRFGLIALLVVLSLVTLCQCTPKPQPDAISLMKTDALTPASIAMELKEASGSQVTWVSLSSDQLSNYYGFAGESLQDFCVYISDSEELSNEIAVFLPKDSDARLRVLDGINQRINKVAATFRNLSATEYKKIQSRLIMELDSMVILAVTNDSELSYNILKEMGAQQINENSGS